MCNIETWAYPSWWGSATTVNISSVAIEFSANRTDVEFLPQGVSGVQTSTGNTYFIPWASLKNIWKTS